MLHVLLRGDTATGVSYSRVYRKDGDNYRVWRVSASRWEFVRTPTGWRIKRRTNRLLNGEPGPRTLMRDAMVGQQGGRP
jgi:hypothetical protein